MIFLTVVAWIAFVLISLIFLAIIVFELTRTPADRRAQEVQDMLVALKTGRMVTRTYWNVRVLAMVVAWLASGAFIFW